MKNFNYIIASLTISIAGVVALLLYTVLVISPKYSNLMVENTEEEALRTGAHIAHMLFVEKGSMVTQESISNENLPMVIKTVQDMEIYKLRLFSSTGEIVFSTVKKEIGQINQKDYFVDIVAKGRPFTKTVIKESKTAEGNISKIDVVESYVPIMRQGKFAGAFELYYDVSVRKKKLNMLMRSLYATLLPFCLVLVALMVGVSANAGKNLRLLQQAQMQLKTAYDEVEQQVQDRTKALRLSNVKLENEIAERKQYEKQMMLAASVFENTIEGIVITDSDGLIQRVNNAFTTITGYQPEEVVGQNPRILKSDRHDGGFYKEMWKSLVRHGMWEGEIWNRRKNGETYPEWLSINAIKDSENNTIHYVGLFHDITDIKHSEEKLKYQANYDALTGLPNRQLFNDRLNMSIAHAARNNLPIGVLFLDLDDFKNINHSLGHYNGDLLLQQVAQRLLKCCREEDTVARLGGDEFLLIAQFVRKEEPAAAKLAERIIDSFGTPFILGENQVHVNASIGITIFPDDGGDIETLVKNADVAMYRAKGSGKNQFQLFTHTLNQEVMRKIALSNDLRGALEREEFILHYQPKVDIRTGAVVGMEALIRWNRFNKKMIPPFEFIPLAEDIGVISPMGEWVLSTACRNAREFSASCGHDIFVAVNLSVRQFRDENLFNMIKKTLGREDFPPNLLTLEITEGIVITDIKETIKILSSLKDLGIHVSIDDFGTGYSSLSYLKKMPLSELKIDKSFIDDTPDDVEASVIVKTILSLAKSLNLKTVAEGVETREQLTFLRQEGCDEIQGYLFSKPLSATDMAALLNEGRKLQLG